MTSPNITSTIEKSTIESSVTQVTVVSDIGNTIESSIERPEIVSSVNKVTIVTEFIARQGLPGTGLSVWGQNDW